MLEDSAGGIAKESVPAAAPGIQGGAASTPQHSTTNVHEAGVDEPDVVKTDGRRVVTVSRGVLRVLDTATRRIIGSVRLLDAQQGWAPSANLLVQGDRALVIVPDVYATDVKRGPYPMPSQPSTRFVLVDLAGAPRVLSSELVSGSYVDARMVGSTVRLVARSVPEIKYPQLSGNPSEQLQKRTRAAVLRAPLSAWLPTYRITEGGTTSSRTVECGQVSHPRDYTGTSMLTVYTVDLTGRLGDAKPITLAADGDIVYGTTTSLYVASNPHWFYAVPMAASVPSGTGKPVPPKTPKQPPEQTQIHRFEISGDGAPRYVASGSVPGRLLNQYSLSDYDGYLRVATTSGLSDTAQQSAVYELNADTMARAGAVSGLGKGQRIYSVRFIGAVGYVVTFRQVDPLYTLDLSDPAHPRVAGEIELTGYSAYLSPAGDGRLIGVGQEASTQGRTTGLQVALFDVHDPAHPKRLAQLVKNASHSNAEWDPHAFLYWPATGTAVLPVNSWDGGQYSASALVLTVTGSKITVQGTIAHPHSDQQAGISRAMVIGSDLWTLSDTGVQVSNASSLATRSWISL
ncbi:MAG TPA: beta-propeller domain-containing protein [Jatrophihabitantaceae bacterium]|jgi:uncharacterized secreted protein with C-terminal beta-propeller domain